MCRKVRTRNSAVDYSHHAGAHYHPVMTGTRSGHGPADRDAGSWATETLPLSVRKELLERELKKLGFRKAGQAGTPHEGGTAQQQQQPQPASEHPQATDGQGSSHSE